MSHALIVDDDRDSAEMMAALVATSNFTVSIAHTLREARRNIALQPPDIVLLDLQLPDGSGMELFDDPELLAQSQVVLITGHASLESSIQALRLGAADYLVKPINIKHLQTILSNVTRPSVLRAEVDTLKSELERSGHFGHLWGRSAIMQEIYQQISRVAVTSVTVLVTGESGTGKEVVARSVHDLSRRRSRPFLAINCGAISPHLMESEIFGHEKGSFTGADRQHQGFFERAHGGTLFLDEITEMPMELQVKLLRVLETGTFMRVGSTQTHETDVRVIAATNRPPEQAVENGKLREDLFYRLNVFPILVPPLRDRIEDVPLLAEHFLADINQTEGAVKRFSPMALDRLREYRWPGNVRELRNVVQRAYVMAVGETITHEYLPLNGPVEEVAAAISSSTVFAAPAPSFASTWSPPSAPPIVSSTPSPQPQTQPQPPMSEPVVAPQGDGGPTATITIPLGTSMADAEAQLIRATLQYYNNHKERTAAVLGVSLKTLYNRLKEYAADKAEEVPSQQDGVAPPERSRADSHDSHSSGR